MSGDFAKKLSAKKLSTTRQTGAYTGRDALKLLKYRLGAAKTSCKEGGCKLDSLESRSRNLEILKSWKSFFFFFSGVSLHQLCEPLVRVLVRVRVLLLLLVLLFFLFLFVFLFLFLFVLLFILVLVLVFVFVFVFVFLFLFLFFVFFLSFFL